MGRGVHNNKQTAGTVKFKLDNGELSLAIILYTSTHQLRPPLTSQQKVGQSMTKMIFQREHFTVLGFQETEQQTAKIGPRIL